LKDKNQGRRTLEMTFVGKVNADISHEFMNVLATIREASGLMEDLLALDKSDFHYREKFIKRLEAIRKQVSRGMEIGETLNRFAHSMDKPKVRLEINDALRHVAFLMQRFVGLAKVQLTVETDESPIEIEADFFRLQMVLALCLEFCLLQTAPGGNITMQPRRTQEGIVIRCISPSDGLKTTADDSAPDVRETLSEALHSMGARLVPIRTPNETGLQLTLPS
jgi:C4-dicarboxylate-specific signal transduction histidine kinase